MSDSDNSKKNARARVKRAMRRALSAKELDRVRELLLSEPYDDLWSPLWVARLYATVDRLRNE